ncbi:neurotrophin 1 [Caerostris darwini]|uniref:Neurotrophin 1 n=1 Tax=Caerostris darwini TaxID=1538125 RepID=A0AAV4RM01_9ARAC|nr:neurotrophin 1 [Caerostris darwini]
MSYTLLLLGLLLIGTVHSQSTTGSPTTNGGLDVVKDSKDKADDLIFIKADNLTGSGDGDLQPEASADRVAFTLDDVRNPMGRTPTTPSDDDLNEEGSDEVVDDVTQELTMFQALLNNGLKLMNNTSNDSDTKKEEDDEDSDEDGEDDEVSYPIPEPTQDFKQEESQIKRQDEPNPEFGENKQSESMFNQPNRDETEPESPIYLTVNDQPSDSESSNDNPPILQLTQGGYQRLPYPTSLSADFAQFSPSNNRMRQRLRSQSASQQAESIENPLSDEQSRQPQATPQVSYTNPFQQPFGFGSVLGLRHPFVPPDSFVNGNGMMPQPAQNGGFFNTPPAGFTDWTQLSPSNDGGFQVLQRNPQGISLFQTPSEQVLPNPYMVRNQQYPQTQLFQ